MKYEQTIIMEQMYKELLEAMFFATTEELNDKVRNIVAEGCLAVAKEERELDSEGAPWGIEDAVAQFKGE